MRRRFGRLALIGSSTGLPRACSGDMYAAVPRINPATVPVWAKVGDGDRPRRQPDQTVAALRPSGES